MFWTPVEAQGEGLDPVKQVLAPSNLLLAVLNRYFWCDSSVLHIVMSMYIWSSAIWSLEEQLPIMFRFFPFCK